MTDTDRLAALLCEVFPAANRNQWPFAAMDVAAFLVAAGVTLAPRCICSHKRVDHTTWCDSEGCPCRFTGTVAALEATDD